MATDKTKYSPFYVIFHSKTEAQAVKAALESKGLEVKTGTFDHAVRALSDPFGGHPSIGNGYGYETFDTVNQWGYGDNFRTDGKFPPKRLNGIVELIAFLDSGKHIVPEETEYIFVETKTKVLKVIAKDAKEAIEKAKGGRGEQVGIATFDLQFRDENI